MDDGELRRRLEGHSEVLRQRGFEVRALEVSSPATAASVAEVEALLGLALPASFRWALTTVAASVSWYWWTDKDLPEPFHQIFSGELSWSIDTLVETNGAYRSWVNEVFADPADSYNAVWHDKLGFLAVANGDFLAVDLAPDVAGRVVYLSHDDGEGHGYVLANSLEDLVDRWVPLACPGAEDWQWLPFVPWDEGPIDPTCPLARDWIELLDLPSDPPRTAPVVPDPDLRRFLLATYRASPQTAQGRQAAQRALKLTTPDSYGDVIDLLRSDDPSIQELAASTLGRWQATEAVPDLLAIVRTGTHNGQIASLLALGKIPGPDADAALDLLRSELDAGWDHYFRPRPSD